MQRCKIQDKSNIWDTPDVWIYSNATNNEAAAFQEILLLTDNQDFQQIYIKWCKKKNIQYQIL